MDGLCVVGRHGLFVEHFVEFRLCIHVCDGSGDIRSLRIDNLLIALSDVEAVGKTFAVFRFFLLKN
jgi:hypothetical protein